MKNKKINFIKLGILFFGISLLLWNCNKEEGEIPIKNSEQNSTFQMSFEKNLNLTEDIITYDLKIPIQKTSLQKNKRTAFSKTKNNFEIITSSVSKIKTENYQAFTFPVKSSSSEFNLQNFVAIKNNDGTIEYLLINYIKNITKNSHFPYHIKYERLDSNLNYINEKFLSKSEEDGDNHSNNDEERECYKIKFLPCGCGGKANGHPPSGPACCAGSPAVLVKIDCDDVNGDGESVAFEEPPCTECTVDPDGNDPVVVSSSGNGGYGNNPLDSDTPYEYYIYKGEEECFADGSCTPPLYISLIEQSNPVTPDEDEIESSEQIINEITDEKIKCLHDNLTKNGNTFVKDLLANFKGDSEFDINISSKDKIYSKSKKSYVNGQTSHQNGNKTIYITISEDKASNQPVLGGIRTILHEYIHADIFRKLNTKYNTQDGIKDFKKTYEKYELEKHHNSMASLYINSMTKSLKEIHKVILSKEYDYLSNNGSKSLDDMYEALAWQGLKNHKLDAWKELGQDTTRINTALTTYYHSLTKTCPK